MEMLDVSLGGGSITFCGVDCTNDIMDDSNPYSVQDVETIGAGLNANGRLITYGKPALAMASVTVVAGSNADNSLRSILAQQRIGKSFNGAKGGGAYGFKVVSGSGKTIYNYQEGVLVSGGGGSASGEGKIGGITYTAAFYALK